MIKLTLLFNFFCVFLVFLSRSSSVEIRPISCIDPDVIAPISNSERKFLLIGSEGSQGAGLGNLLIFFPSAFWFASFTNRNIIIACGFPFASEIANAFPQLFDKNSFKYVEDVKHSDYFPYFEGSKNITARVVRSWGYTSASDWWAYYNTTAHCVKKITGCDLGDIACKLCS